MPNVVVGQSGGPTAVINASLAGVIEAASSEAKLGCVFGMRRGVEGLLRSEIVDLGDMTSDQLDSLARTPGAALGSCRHRILDAEAEQLVKWCVENDVGIFCYIGGNDSADTTLRVANTAAALGSDLRAIAIPKTIDNDLPETDHCPGFPSVARYVAVAAAESTLDTRSLPTNYPVKVIEVMGRDAGWLAASSGLARRDERDGPHLIYVPELPFDLEQFLNDVAATHKRIGYCVVVVAETIRDREGKSVASDVASVDMFGHPIVRGVAESLVRVVEERLKLPARAEKPGSLQRSSQMCQSSIDMAEARESGRTAVSLAVSGESGRMVTIQRLSNDPYRSQLSSVDITKIANQQRLLPRHFLDSAGTGITQAFRDYALPLLGEDPFPDLFRF